MKKYLKMKYVMFLMRSYDRITKLLNEVDMGWYATNREKEAQLEKQIDHLNHLIVVREEINDRLETLTDHQQEEIEFYKKLLRKGEL